MAGTEEIVNALDSASDRQLARMLVVLSRAAPGRSGLAAAAKTALDQRLPQIVHRLATASEWEEETNAAVRLVIEAVRPAEGAIAAIGELPQRSMLLAPLAADVTALAAEALESAAEDEPDRLPDLAASLHNLSVRLAEVGRREEGLAAAEKAVAAYRNLAEDRAEEFQPALALSLNNVSVDLAELGRHEEGLTAAEEAVAVYWGLTEDDAEEFLPDLAMSLNNLSNRLSEVGRPAKALAVAEDAVAAYRRAVEQDPEEVTPDFAIALTTLANRLAETGRREEALAAIEEGVRIRRVLVEESSDAYLPDLAAALTTLANRLGEVGRREKGLEAGEESVSLYRVLAEDRPEAYLPRLARALSNLSVDLGQLGRREEGLAAAEEAVETYRLLADDYPELYLPELARSLNNVSNRLGRVGRRREGLATAEEAVAAYRLLAEASPEVFLTELATAVHNLSHRLGDLRRHAEGLAAIEEAVDLRRTLVAQRGEVAFADLASSLISLSVDLGGAGKHQEALAAAEEAVAAYRSLAAKSPGAFMPEVARSLTNLSDRLAALGRAAEGLAAAQEAVTLRRILAADRREVFLPDLALSLLTLGSRQRELGRYEEGLEAAEEAVGAFETLAVDKPEVFAPDLASALTDLAGALEHLGRPREARRYFCRILGAHAHDPWVTGLLLLSRARWRRQRAELASTVRDAWDATQRLASDTVRRAEARWLLRSMRGDDLAAFNRAWDHVVGGDQPVWLRFHGYDRELADQVDAWVRTPTWDASQDFLSLHAGVLLTDRAEAAAEHMIDANLGHAELERHRDLLQAARAHGIDVAYEGLRQSLREGALAVRLLDWVATPSTEASRSFLEAHAAELLTDEAESVLQTLVEDHPDVAELLPHLGLLGLCRLDGIEAGHALLDDPERLRAEPGAPLDGDPRRALAQARLGAGAHHEDPEAHLRHAIAAAAAGMAAEAGRAVSRCAETSTSWDRAGMARRLDELAAARPALATDILHLRALLTRPLEDGGHG